MGKSKKSTAKAKVEISGLGTGVKVFSDREAVEEVLDPEEGAAEYPETVDEVEGAEEGPAEESEEEAGEPEGPTQAEVTAEGKKLLDGVQEIEQAVMRIQSAGHPVRYAAVRLIQKFPGLQVSAAATALGTSNATMNYHLNNLLQIGVLCTRRVSRSRQYHLTKNGEAMMRLMDGILKQ